MAADAPSELAPASRGIDEREWPQPWMAVFLRNLASLPNVSAAARGAGISRRQVYRTAEENPDFADAWREAFDVGIDLGEQLAYRRGSTGEDFTVTRVREKRNAEGLVVETETVTETRNRVSDTLLLSWLRAHRPGKWAERVDHRHGGDPDGVPIQHEVGPRVRTPERLAALAAIAEEQREREALEAVRGADGVYEVAGEDGEG